MNNYDYLDDEYEALPKQDRMPRKTGNPVSNRMGTLKRAECTINRNLKEHK